MKGKKLYVYKLVADNGGAPCVWRGLLSLAICKPKIRRSAERGDVVFGFGGKEYKERLIYIARLTKELVKGDYYRRRQYASRPDCIYRDIGGNAQRKSRARYHRRSDERRKDVGLRFERANVILSRDFRYFGRKGTDDYKRKFPAVAALVEGLKRGHRVSHSESLRRELLELKRRIWHKYRRMTIGKPTDADRSGLCNLDSPSARC